MVCRFYSIDFRTSGEDDFVDVTKEVLECVEQSAIPAGIASVSVRSTTSSIVVCENEAGLKEDIKDALRKIAPSEKEYRHNEAWHDENGRSHVKATLTGQGITLPVTGSRLLMGQWQSIFLLEFDVKPRTRTVDVAVVG